MSVQTYIATYNEPEANRPCDPSHHWVHKTKEGDLYKVTFMHGWIEAEETTTQSWAVSQLTFNHYIQRIGQEALGEAF